MKPSALGLRSWKLKVVLKPWTETALVLKALAASPSPPLVSCRAEPLMIAEPLRVSPVFAGKSAGIVDGSGVIGGGGRGDVGVRGVADASYRRGRGNCRGYWAEGR